MSLALLALGLAAGIVARRLAVFGDAAPQRVNTFIVAVALPAVILLRVPSLQFDARAIWPVALGWGVILSSALLVLAAARVWRWPATTTGALLMVVPLSNSAYLGVPLIDALLGPTVVPYAILYDQFANFMALSLYAPVVMSVLGPNVSRATVASVLLRIVSFPPFFVLVMSLLMPADLLPALLRPALGLLGATMGPLAMFIIGLQLEIAVPRALRAPLAVATGIKLLWAPLVAVGAAAMLGLDGPPMQAAAMQAAMPPMITAGLLAMVAGFSGRLIVAVVGVASLISAFTLPLVWWVVQ